MTKDKVYEKNKAIEPAELLIVAIVEQAVHDYRKALLQLKTDPLDNKACCMVKDCESFFRSQWFFAVSDLEGEVVIKHLQSEQ